MLHVTLYNTKLFCKQIGKLQRNFLWGGMGDVSKLHLANWNKACSLLNEGGFGFANWVLLTKPFYLDGYGLWRFETDERIFSHLYEVWRHFFFLFRSSHRVGLLKIIRGWNNFFELIKFVVGDGSWVHFLVWLVVLNIPWKTWSV